MKDFGLTKTMLIIFQSWQQVTKCKVSFYFFFQEFLKLISKIRTPIQCGSTCSLNLDCIGFTVIKANCRKLRLNDFQEIPESANALNVWLSEYYLKKLRPCFKERTKMCTGTFSEINHCLFWSYRASFQY